MTHHSLTTPVTEGEVRALQVGDQVTLEGTLFGIRDATLFHMFDKGRRTRLDLQGHAVIHTAPNVRKVPVSPEYPAGYAPVCIGTTTSIRMERFTRPLMEREGVRIVIGKGGMGPGSLDAFSSIGGAGSPLSTVELFQSAFSRVDETTYLGMLLNLSPNSPSTDGHADAKAW